MLNSEKLKKMIINNNFSDTITLPAALNANFNRCHHCYQYRLIIYNSKLSRLLFGKKERAKLIKKDEEFYLIKDNSGNLLNPSPEHQTIFMSVGKTFSKDKNYFQLKNGRKSITLKIKIKLNFKDWGLHELDAFLESKEERALAEKLILQGYEVKTITYNDQDKLINGCADILVNIKSRNVPIEITTTAPSESFALSGINSPHGHQWAKIAVRILPLLIYTSENKIPSFLVMNKRWEKYQHVSYFIKMLERFKCYVISSDFATDWANSVANKILEISNN